MKSNERNRIYKKFGGRCAYCGDPLGLTWHVDHLLPVKRGWRYKKDETGNPIYDKYFTNIKEYYLEHPERDTFENKVPACASCNINKRSFSIEEFRATIKKFVVSLNTHSVQYKVAKRYGLIQENDKKIIFYFETF